jgi:hypothetical protein
MMQTLMTKIREFVTRGVTYGSPMVALSSQGEKKGTGSRPGCSPQWEWWHDGGRALAGAR